MGVSYLDQPRPLAFAHRGGAAHYPENTLAAFEYAVRLGYAYLETDTRATADGRLIAFHDAGLGRVTDRTGPVGKLPWKEVAAAKVSGTESIPLLEDVLGTFPQIRFNIDLKGPGSIEPLIGVLRRTGAWDRVCVTSFSGKRLLAAQRSLDQPVCLDVHVWTVNGRAQIERVLDLGADGVMTDDVLLLRDVLAERGQWHPRVTV